MRILYHHRIHSKDGQFVHLEEMVAALRALGHEVLIVGPPAVEREQFGAGGGLVGLLKRTLPRALYELLELAYALADYLRLRAAIRRFRPDAIYERYNLYTPSGVWARRAFNLPLLLEVNAPLYEERSANDGIGLPWLARWSQRYTWRGADFAAPVTQVLAGYLERTGVPRERIVVIGNAINPTHFAAIPDTEDAKRRLRIQGRFVLGFTGFVRPWHGLDRILEFVAEPANAHLLLLLVGDGPARAGLEQRARDLGISERLRVTGVIGREQVPDYVAAFDVALQPHVVEYASPLKMLEYLALGRAILAPDTANIRELLEDGRNGLLFEPGNQAAMRAALERLCRDPALRKRLSAAAHATIGDRRISWQENARRAVELLESCRRTPAARPHDRQRVEIGR
jgi:glycosyltransferase involved in cell wall biosynthesis